jgi:flagellar biosynthesis protein FliP
MISSAFCRKSLPIFLLCGFGLFPERSSAASSTLVELDSYFKVIWGLLVVLAIILVLYWLLRKRFSLLASHPEHSIKVLEIKPLMGKKALCLITVKDNEYLLGISGDRINHLATLPKVKPEPSFAETLRASEENRQPMKPSSRPDQLTILLFPAILYLVFHAEAAWAIGLPTITFGVDDAQSPQQISTALQVLLLLTVLSMAPAILLMTTCFTRIVIVLGFVRQAMGTQNMPPTQVILGLSLFLSFFIMSPTINKINEDALQPYFKEQISQADALEKGLAPLREFMLSQVREEELLLLTEITMKTDPVRHEDIPTMTLIPAFMLSELKRAFTMGFMIYIPFLVIDMIVASILMSMGMMMLPPVIISMPFKLLLFVLVDGWSLVVGSLIKVFTNIEPLSRRMP